jgi:adenylate cyclase
MRTLLASPSEPAAPAEPRRPGSRLLALADRWPFLSLFLVALLSNLVGSVFNLLYNHQLIEGFTTRTAAQKEAFWVTVFLYNGLAWPLCLGLWVYLQVPLFRCRRDLRAGRDVAPDRLNNCRRLLVSLPFYQVCINGLGWLPGTVLFPLGICLLGGWDNAGEIWLQFGLSFTVSTLLTTIQTYFLIEAFVIRVLYPDFFRGARPAEVAGAVYLPVGLRLLLLWGSVAVVPLLALVAVALQFTGEGGAWLFNLRYLALAVAAVSFGCGGLISWLVGRNLITWLEAHEAATLQIARGNFDVRVHELRPDEWGQLTDRFNDMAQKLGEARRLRETFGQFVNPEVLDDILRRFPGLGGEVQEITVLFADIRGFTRRSAQEAPECVVTLLNRFLTLGVAAVEDNGGSINKFLGDGFMALFGVRRGVAQHADLAVRAALKLLAGLKELNRELDQEGQAPLAIGVGIHTGPALVGCVGATLADSDGGKRVRREFTAIGKTVNLAQRLEQLTKQCCGPILLSEATRQALTQPVALTPLGPQTILDLEGMNVYRVNEE